MPVIDDVQKVKDNPNSIDLKVIRGDIDFKSVNFNYSTEENKILNSINLKIPGEKMTALVGHSGAGKSTILNLIPRFYNIDNGDIMIDKQSIYKSTIFSLEKIFSGKSRYNAF